MERALPARDSFPLRLTVYSILRKLQRDGVWEAIWAEYMVVRQRMGRGRPVGRGPFAHSGGMRPCLHNERPFARSAELLSLPADARGGPSFVARKRTRRVSRLSP